MGRVVSNDVSAIQPELWSQMIQVPLYKRLVSFEVCSRRLESELKYGDTLHIPKFGDLSAQTYTPGTPFSATNQDKSYPVLYKSFLNNVKTLNTLTLSFNNSSMIVYGTRY